MTRSQAHRPSVGPSFFKGHGHGNDYLVFEEGTGWSLGPEQIRTVCHPHRGAGSDGIVVVGGQSADGAVALRMFNPDGSEFERSGNGLRVLAAYLYRAGRVGDEPFMVSVGGDRVMLQVLGQASDGGLDIRVDMGVVRFGPSAVDLDMTALSTDPDGQVMLDHPELGEVVVHPVSVGNPHAVCFLGALDVDRLTRLGPWISGHRGFKNSTNVQLAHVEGPGRLGIHIWERGVGRTASSGTSACAAAAAAVSTGRVEPGRVKVLMEGGDFDVTVGPDYEVVLEGPVTSVLYGTLTEDLLGTLR